MSPIAVAVLPTPSTFQRLIDGPIADVERRRDRDEAIADAIGYRLTSGLRRQPWTDLTPPDVCVMRLMASEGQHQTVVSELIAILARTTGNNITLALIKLGDEHWLMHGVPYHLPGKLGVELLTSDPPDPDLLERIRLPYRSVLVFFDQINLDTLAAAQLDATLHLDSDTATTDPASRCLIGVTLAAKPDGRLEPWVQWLIAEYVIDRGWSVGTTVGLWQRSAYPGAVANVAAICTWGDWHPPPAPPPQIEGVEGSRPWRRSLHRSASRRALQRGALTGVHVLHVPNASPTTTNPEPATTATRRTIRTHWRAGHWQNYRLATRDQAGSIIGSIRGARDVDWHYEARWVRPTLVAGDRPELPAMTVYQLHPGPAPANGSSQPGT